MDWPGLEEVLSSPERSTALLHAPFARKAARRLGGRGAEVETSSQLGDVAWGYVLQRSQ